MELARIEALLDAYFEGQSTLEQENQLREYFTTQDVAPHLMAYKGLFVGLKAAQEEVLEKEVTLPRTITFSRRSWLSIAASIVIVLGVAGLQFSNSNQLTEEEEIALAEFNKSKETLLLLSKSFNKGTAELAALGEFTEAKNKIIK